MSDITYGIDEASPYGDEMALTIKRGVQFFTFTGDEAEVIEALIHEQVRLARIKDLVGIVNLGEAGYVEAQDILEELRQENRL